MKARSVVLLAMLLGLGGCFPIIVRPVYPVHYRLAGPRAAYHGQRVIYPNIYGGYGYQQGFQPPQPPPYHSHTTPPQPRPGWYYYGPPPPAATAAPPSQTIGHGPGNVQSDAVFKCGAGNAKFDDEKK